MKLLLKLLKAFGERFLEVSVSLDVLLCKVAPLSTVWHSLTGACRLSVTSSSGCLTQHGKDSHTCPTYLITRLTLEVQLMTAESNPW